MKNPYGIVQNYNTKVNALTKFRTSAVYFTINARCQ